MGFSHACMVKHGVIGKQVQSRSWGGWNVVYVNHEEKG